MGLKAHHIDSGLLSARITNFGASLMDLRLSGVATPLVLGFPNVADYSTDGQFMGAVIGRYANRIGGGHVPWGHDALQLETNEGGTAHLHGGRAGFGTQIWGVDSADDTAITFRLISPEGHAGYPGAMTATACYRVSGATLTLTLSAKATKTTIVNLCHHPYFNLDGSSDIRNHKLWIGAAHYLPCTASLLPTGQIAPVSGSAFDFSTMGLIPAMDFNHSYCLHRTPTGPLYHAASLRAGSVTMQVYTTQPGLHFYNGYKISAKSSGHTGRPYAAGAGLCLEAQAWPDSPNQPGFPCVTLPAGQLYQQVTEYRFTSSTA